MSAKRLIKDLPGFQEGTVFCKANGRYDIHKGETIYSGNLFSSSSNGVYQTEQMETDLINLLWDNSEWMEDASFSRAKWNVKDNIISITFERDVDPDELLTVAKIMHKILGNNFRELAENMGHNGAQFLNIFS